MSKLKYDKTSKFENWVLVYKIWVIDFASIQ